MSHERIKLEMSMQEIVLVMSKGNPGAIGVCMGLLKYGDKIDPQNILGGVGAIMHLDSLDIHEERIWMLYKDVCGENLGRMIGLLRATQLGMVHERDLKFAIDNRGQGLDVEHLLSLVKERLTEFNPEYELPSE